MKDSCWYEVEGDTLYIYDAPQPKHSKSVSIVGVESFGYYRNNFRLRKVRED